MLGGMFWTDEAPMAMRRLVDDDTMTLWAECRRRTGFPLMLEKKARHMLGWIT